MPTCFYFSIDRFVQYCNQESRAPVSSLQFHQLTSIDFDWNGIQGSSIETDWDQSSGLIQRQKVKPKNNKYSDTTNHLYFFMMKYSSVLYTDIYVQNVHFSLSRSTGWKNLGCCFVCSSVCIFYCVTNCMCYLVYFSLSLCSRCCCGDDRTHT